MGATPEKIQHDNAEKIKDTGPSVEQIKKPETVTTKMEAEHGHESQVENLHTEAIEKARSTKEQVDNLKVERENQHPVLVNKQLKDMAYSRALTRTRKHLSIPSRLLSRVVHSKALDRPSETVGKTIARPSSMLGGAFFALVGTSALLWITKKYGYEYNYLAVIVLFGIGMLVGLAIESLYKLIRRP